MRKISDSYFVSPQISPEDVAALKAAGITTVICNRPDDEVPPMLQAAALRRAVEAAGLRFQELPLTHQTMTPENVAQQADMAAASDGPVLAYCASGTRSTVVWALGQAQSGAMGTDDILRAATQGGYNLDGLRPTLDALTKASRG